MNDKTILGIDLGGTNVRGGLVRGNNLSGMISKRIDAGGTTEEVLRALFSFTDELVNSAVIAIGIGVPGLVNEGIVYDVVNIPSWKQVSLQSLMEERYKLPVVINNDANCFALGEFYYGKGSSVENMVGLTIGTGLGSGIIINRKLYSGKNCGAGEFGMISYLDRNYEYYASGRFFQNVYGISGETAYMNACKENEHAIKMFEELGMHLGNAIKTILYTLDVDKIILGGSVAKAFPYFSRTMWESLQIFEFKRTLASLQIEVSELDNSGILGAAALFHDLYAG